MIQNSTPGLKVEIVDLEEMPQERVPQTHSCGFAYTIKIANDSNVTVKLLGRKWMIKHADGHLDTVEGEGVVGKQPVIEPGDSHTYTSYCLLHGDSGAMWGFYFGKDDEDTPVIWAIPKFEMSKEI